MNEKRSQIFARLIIRPNHFEKNIISWRCFNPRPNDKDGISVCKCSEIELIGLKRLGEKIAENQRKVTPECEFYGFLFFLEQNVIEKFDLAQVGKSKYHYTIKHKNVDYSVNSVQIGPEIRRDQAELLNESLIISKNKIEEILRNPNYSPDNLWDAVYNKLIAIAKEDD